jgi:hypothetical protein
VADEPAPQTETEPQVEERLGRVEAAVARIEQAVSEALGGVHKDSAEVVEARLDADSSVAAEVQRELARRDEATRKAEEADRLGKVEETIAGLTEKTPLPPVRKIEHIMGWHG